MLLRCGVSAKKIATSTLGRALAIPLAVGIFLSVGAGSASCQAQPSPDNATPDENFWPRFAVGFAASIAAHETAHFATALAVGAHPYVAFDKGRPTVFSGIDSRRFPHKQFLFSAAGLTTQTLLNEVMLDFRHAHAGPVERGMLAGGIATTLFYVTLGRNGDVSDLELMSRNSSLSKLELSLIFGGASAIQALRISRDRRFAHFFFAATTTGGAIGLSFTPAA